MGKLYDSLIRNYENISEEELKEYADNYIGHPQDIDESISTTIKRNAFIDGFKCAKEKLEIEYFERFKEARQEDKEKLIAEACCWLEENIDLYAEVMISNKSGYNEIVMCDNFEQHFRKAMEDLKLNLN